VTLDIKFIDDTKSDLWNQVIASSSHATIFHTWKWLKIVGKYTNTTFYPIVVYNGTNIAAIYPVFIQRKGFFNLAFSPPSHAYLLYLGPVIAEYENKKQDKKISTFTEIQHEVDKYLFQTLKCKYARIRLSPTLFDSRPLRWCGYTIDPLYTYRINLRDGKEKVWDQFDRKLRVSINRAMKEGIVVQQGSGDDLLLIERELARRQREQGTKSPDHSSYLAEIYENFKDNMKIFLAYHQEKMAGSLVALRFKDVLQLWIGTPKSDLKGISPNDLVQWEAIQWACDNGLNWFENMDGGDNPRLTTYKSKYNPEPFIWFSATKYSSVFYQIGERLLKL